MDSGAQSSPEPSHAGPVPKLDCSLIAAVVSNPLAHSQLHVDTSTVYQLQVHSFSLERLSSSPDSSILCTGQSQSSSNGVSSPQGFQT